MPELPGLSQPRVERVGHKGADALAPGNTIESFEAAVRTGVDTIEFDVLRRPDGRLVLAHDPEDAARREPLSLEEGLDHLAGAAYADVGLCVDLKQPGYEPEVLEALGSRNLEARVLVSSAYAGSLDRIGAIAPALPRGWSVPRVRRDWLATPVAPLAYAAAWLYRSRLPRLAAGMLRDSRCEAVMSHWLLASRRLAEATHGAGGRLYVWTVDDAAALERMAGLGIDGVITNDPRLFSAASSSGPLAPHLAPP